MIRHEQNMYKPRPFYAQKYAVKMAKYAEQICKKPLNFATFGTFSLL